MKHSVRQTTVVILELTQDEANWLHSVMQNPLYNQTPDEETPSDREMRLKFFNGTTQFKKNNPVAYANTGSCDSIFGVKS